MNFDLVIFFITNSEHNNNMVGHYVCHNKDKHHFYSENTRCLTIICLQPLDGYSNNNTIQHDILYFVLHKLTWNW